MPVPGFFQTTWQRHPRLVLAIVAVAAFLILRQMAATKRQKEAEINDIRQQIATGVGAAGLDIKTLVHGVTPAPGYNAAPKVTIIHDAHGYIFQDSQAVFAAFAGLTIRQIASLVQAFLATYGLDLDAYLYNGNYFTGFLTQTEYQQVVGIVQAARTAAGL